MANIYGSCSNAAKEYGLKRSFADDGNITGFTKVTDVMNERVHYNKNRLRSILILGIIKGFYFKQVREETCYILVLFLYQYLKNMIADNIRGKL